MGLEHQELISISLIVKFQRLNEHSLKILGTQGLNRLYETRMGIRKPFATSINSSKDLSDI